MNHRRNQVNTFRVSRISKQPEILDEAATPAQDSLNLANYSHKVLRMHDTEEPVEVSPLCESSLMEHLTDHFDLGVETETVDNNHFRARVLVCTSPAFYRQIFGWYDRMKIESPVFVLDEYYRVARVTLE